MAKLSCRICWSFNDLHVLHSENNIDAPAHIACGSCIRMWVNRKLTSKGLVICLICCKRMISDQAIRAALKHDDRLSLQFERAVSGVDSMTDVVTCPKYGCPTIGFVRRDTPPKYCWASRLWRWFRLWMVKAHQAQRTTMTTPPTAWCSRCRRCWKLAPHLSDDPESEKRSIQWKTKKTLDCPVCGVATEKHGGCRHVSCTRCRYEWCYLCTGPYPYCFCLPTLGDLSQFVRKHQTASVVTFALFSVMFCFFVSLR